MNMLPAIDFSRLLTGSLLRFSWPAYARPGHLLSGSQGGMSLMSGLNVTCPHCHIVTFVTGS